MVATLKISLYREKPFLKTLLNGICKKSLKLVKHLRVSTSEMMTYPSELKMEQMVDDLYRGKEHVLTVYLRKYLGGSTLNRYQVTTKFRG
jgi:hypothetical protein